MTTLKIGDKAPAFEGIDQNGNIDKIITLTTIQFLNKFVSTETLII